MPHVDVSFSAIAFLRAKAPVLESVAAADGALAAALAATKTEAVAAQERVRVADLAWEHERTVAGDLARRVTAASSSH
jgi:hypothetical protein